MTIIVGILCDGGVVIGADSSATFSDGARQRTVEQRTDKITIIDNRVIVACTGEVGLAQRFGNVVEQLWHQQNSEKDHHTFAAQVTKAASENFRFTNASPNIGALVAFPLSGRPYLCEFAYNTLQPEFKEPNAVWYVSLGSGQPIVDPFLGFIREVFWHETMPNLQLGTFSAIWALDHAVKLNPGGINGPLKVTLLQKDATGALAVITLTEEDMGEYQLHIEGIKEEMRHRYETMGRATQGADEVPTVPPTP